MSGQTPAATATPIRNLLRRDGTGVDRRGRRLLGTHLFGPRNQRVAAVIATRLAVVGFNDQLQIVGHIGIGVNKGADQGRGLVRVRNDAEGRPDFRIPEFVSHPFTISLCDLAFTPR